MLWNYSSVTSLRTIPMKGLSMSNIVQQRFWIFGVRNVLRSIKNKCITCRRGRAQTMTPVMAELPTERLDASTALANVDYIGPFTVKIGRRHGHEKRWCCLFTCLTVRAAHIEIIPKLDTDSCLNAILRFIARRGEPIKMINDNGTNFVGADREFEVCVAAWNKERIEEHLVQQGIRWELTRLPRLTLEEYGKDWSEVAKAIYAVLGNRPITEVVLSTTMCLVEQTLNARPLIPVSSDVNDLESITPNHFLLGNKNVCLPYLPCAEKFVSHRKLFRQTQAYSDLIWDRFRKEYVPALNNRQKWNCQSNRILSKGDLVWLVEDSDKRGYYKLGPVTETMEGSDRTIRSATVQTKDSLQEACGETRSSTINGRRCFREGKQGQAMLEPSSLSLRRWENRNKTLSVVLVI